MKRILFIFALLFSISVQAQETELKFPEEFLGEWEGYGGKTSAKLIVTQEQIECKGGKYIDSLADITLLKKESESPRDIYWYDKSANISNIYIYDKYLYPELYSSLNGSYGAIQVFCGEKYGKTRQFLNINLSIDLDDLKEENRIRTYIRPEEHPYNKECQKLLEASKN